MSSLDVSPKGMGTPRPLRTCADLIPKRCRVLSSSSLFYFSWQSNLQCLCAESARKDQCSKLTLIGRVGYLFFSCGIQLCVPPHRQGQVQGSPTEGAGVQCGTQGSPGGLDWPTRLPEGARCRPGVRACHGSEGLPGLLSYISSFICCHVALLRV